MVVLHGIQVVVDSEVVPVPLRQRGVLSTDAYPRHIPDRLAYRADPHQKWRKQRVYELSHPAFLLIAAGRTSCPTYVPTAGAGRGRTASTDIRRAA